MGKPATESERAKAACADYISMGPGRSLSLLAKRYQSQTEPIPPTRRELTLREWSSAFGWQARVAEHEAQFREAQQSEADKARLQSLGLVRAAKGLVIQSIQRARGEAPKGSKAGPKFTAHTVSDMERLVKLELSLLGNPLAERHEHTGVEDAPPIMLELGNITNEQLRDLIENVTCQLAAGAATGALATDGAEPDPED